MPDQPLRTGFKALEYRLIGSEPFMIHRLRRIPWVATPATIRRVRTAALAERLAKAARSRQILPGHLGNDAPQRQYVALIDGASRGGLGGQHRRERRPVRNSAAAARRARSLLRTPHVRYGGLSADRHAAAVHPAQAAGTEDLKGGLPPRWCRILCRRRLQFSDPQPSSAGPARRGGPLVCRSTFSGYPLSANFLRSGGNSLRYQFKRRRKPSWKLTCTSVYLNDRFTRHHSYRRNGGGDGRVLAQGSDRQESRFKLTHYQSV